MAGGKVMIPGGGRDAAIERALAGLARADASPVLTEAVRRRMHEHLSRTAHRRVRQRPVPVAPRRWAAEAALAAAGLLAYLVTVIGYAIGLYDR
jgi:hypothetical protein